MSGKDVFPDYPLNATEPISYSYDSLAGSSELELELELYGDCSIISMEHDAMGLYYYGYRYYQL